MKAGDLPKLEVFSPMYRCLSSVGYTQLWLHLHVPNVDTSFYVADESQLADRDCDTMQSTYARPLSYHEHDVTQMNVSLLKAELKDMSSDRDVLRDELAKVRGFAKLKQIQTFQNKTG